MSRLLNHGSCGLNFIEADIVRADNGNDNAVSHVDGGLEQRAGNCLACSLCSLVLACSGAGADVSEACVLHDGGNVREVQVDEARNGDQLGNVLNCLTQNAVSDLECVLEGDLLLGYILQTLVRDDNEGVYVLVQLFDAAQRLLETLLALECERTGNNADRQDAHIFCDTCNNRSCTCTGTAAHAGGDKYHIGVSESRCDLILALLSSLAADFRICACALTLGQLLADLDLRGGLRIIQSLHIRVDGNELNTLYTVLDHAVYSVAAAAADTDDLNVYYVIQALFKLKTHCRCPPFYDKESFFDYQLPRLRALRPYCFNFTSIYSILQQELANSSKKT